MGLLAQRKMFRLLAVYPKVHPGGLQPELRIFRISRSLPMRLPMMISPVDIEPLSEIELLFRRIQLR